MKRTLPYIINTFCYVTILVLLSIIAIYADCMNCTFPLTFVWYAMSNGAVSALLTLLFITDTVIKDCPLWLRMGLFLLALYGSVTSLSIVFDIINPSNTVEVVTMCVIIAIIFLAVWTINTFSYRQQEKELTKKLLEFNESLDDDE